MNPFDTAKDMTKNLISFNDLSTYTCFAITVSICIIVSLFLVCKYLYKDRSDVDKVDF